MSLPGPPVGVSGGVGSEPGDQCGSEGVSLGSVRQWGVSLGSVWQWGSEPGGQCGSGGVSLGVIAGVGEWN